MPNRLHNVLAIVLVGLLGSACVPAFDSLIDASASGLPASPTVKPPIVPPTPTPRPTFLVHVVAGGDNLNSIGRRYGTTARSIAFWNRATYPTLDPEAPGYRPDLLQVGWTLALIPNALFDEDGLPDPTPDAAGSGDPAALSSP